MNKNKDVIGHLIGSEIKTICGIDLDRIDIWRVHLHISDCVAKGHELCKTCEKYAKKFQEDYK